MCRIEWVFTCWFVERVGQESSLLLRGAGKKWMISQLEVDKTCSGVSMGSGFDKKWEGRRMCVTRVILCIVEGRSRVWNS